jgi:hypothetical protein
MGLFRSRVGERVALLSMLNASVHWILHRRSVLEETWRDPHEWQRRHL